MYELKTDTEAAEWVSRVWDSYNLKSEDGVPHPVPTFWQCIRATLAILLNNYNPTIGNPWHMECTHYQEGTVMAFKSIGRYMTEWGEAEAFMELRIHGFAYNILEDSTL